MTQICNKKTWLSLALILILAPIFIFGQAVYSQAYSFIDNSGLNTTANTSGFETGTASSSVDSIIGTAILAGLGLIGVIFFTFMLLGGFNWMTSSGNEEKLSKAKDTLLNSIVGLLIALAAYAISYFLISYFS